VETFTKGDVVLFPFPYTDLKGKKIRPCLVLSNEMNQDILLCQITSKEILKDEYSVLLKKDETIGGSLTIDSLVRTNMLFTANKFQIIKKFCKVSNKKYLEIITKVIDLVSI